MQTFPADYFAKRIFMLRWLYGPKVASDMIENFEHLDALQKHKIYQEDMRIANDMQQDEHHEMRIIFLNYQKSNLEYSLNRLSLQEAKEFSENVQGKHEKECADVPNSYEDQDNEAMTSIANARCEVKGKEVVLQLNAVGYEEMQCNLEDDDCATVVYVNPTVFDEMQCDSTQDDSATLEYPIHKNSDETKYGFAQDGSSTLVYVCPWINSSAIAIASQVETSIITCRKSAMLC